MEQDLGIWRCLSDTERYADLLNGLLFHGSQKVQAGDLQETEARSFSGDRTNRELHSLCRDMICKTAFGVNFALIGVENQTLVHYLMPLRTMQYDAAEYEKQAVRIRKLVRKEKGSAAQNFCRASEKKINYILVLRSYCIMGMNGMEQSPCMELLILPLFRKN